MSICVGSVFWCPMCTISFSKADENGVAMCPRCGYKRTDGFNLLTNDRLQCVLCKATFPVFLQQAARKICPNKCNYKGEENA